MAGDFLFAAGTISASRYGGRKPTSLLAAVRHNRRRIQAEMGAQSRIDPSRSTSNETLCGPSEPEAVVALADKLLRDAGIDPARLRKDRCQAVELVFSLAPDAGIDDGQYFQKCLRWVRQSFRVEVLAADIHRDEAAPHCHVLLSPVQAGQMVGSKLIGRAALAKLRESFMRAVAGPAGLKRPGGKIIGQAKRWAAEAVLARLEQVRDGALRSPVWPLIREMIERDPVPFLQVLNIDPASIRPQVEAEKPIGFKPQQDPVKPIGFAKPAEKDRNLSCVGFASQTSPIDRLAVAREAAAGAVLKHARKHKPVPTDPVVQAADDGGVVRVRDADFDLDEWSKT